MRKITNSIILVLLVALLLPSCSKDEDGPDLSGDISGSWEYFQLGRRNGSAESLVPYQHQQGCNKDNVVFSASGTITTFFYDLGCELFTDNGTYTRNGANLVITESSETRSLEIKELTSTTLKVYETYTEDGLTITEITVFKKVN